MGEDGFEGRAGLEADPSIAMCSCCVGITFCYLKDGKERAFGLVFIRDGGLLLAWWLFS